MSNNGNELYGFGAFILDASDGVLSLNGETVAVAPKTLETLILLVRNHGKLMSKDVLMEELWTDTFVEERNLAQHIFRLRKIIGEDENGNKYIETVPRRGYRFAAAVHKIAPRQGESYGNDPQSISIPSDSYISEPTVPNHDDRSKSKLFGIPTLGFGAVILAMLIGSAFFLFNVGSTSFSKLTPQNITFDRLTETGSAFFPVVSRDSRNLAYVSNETGDYSIILQNLETGSKTTVVDPQPHELRSVRFSADGNHIFYAVRDPELPESTIYKTPVFGGEQIKILTGVRHEFSVSTDGKKLAFLRYRPSPPTVDVVVSDDNGKNEKVIATRRHPLFYQEWGGLPSWSKDDESILVTGWKEESEEKLRTKQLIEIELSNGQERIVKTPDWVHIYQTFRINEKHAIVLAKETAASPNQLWKLDLETGQSVRITNDTNHYASFAMSRDSSSLIVEEKRRSANIFLADLGNPKDVTQITRDSELSNGIGGLAWTSDGKQLLFTRNDNPISGNIIKIDLESLETEQLTRDNSAGFRKIEVTPDGKFAYFGSNRSKTWQVWQINLINGELTQITENEGGGLPEVTSDGKWLIYHYPGVKPLELRKLPIADQGAIKNTAPEKILKNAHGSSDSSPADPNDLIAGYFSPDSNEDNRWKIIRFSPKKEPNYQNLETLDFIDTPYAWEKSGKGVYFAKRNFKSNNVWYLNLDTKKSRQLTELENLDCRNMSLSPDGKKLAIACRQVVSNVFRISPEEGN